MPLSTEPSQAFSSAGSTTFLSDGTVPKRSAAASGATAEMNGIDLATPQFKGYKRRRRKSSGSTLAGLTLKNHIHYSTEKETLMNPRV